MPLKFDPSALLAQGGIMHGLDDLGSAVMNAMNSRAARKYQTEREDKQRTQHLADLEDVRITKGTDEKRTRRYQWWHDAASAGPDEKPAYSGLDAAEIEQLESIRLGKLSERQRLRDAADARVKAIPPPPQPGGAPTARTELRVNTTTGKVTAQQVPLTIDQGVQDRTGLAVKARQGGKEALAQAYDAQANQGKEAAAVLGDPSVEELSAESTSQASAKKATEALGAADAELRAVPMVGGSTWYKPWTWADNEHPDVAKTTAALGKIADATAGLSKARQRAHTASKALMDKSGALSPFSNVPLEDQATQYGDAVKAKEQFYSGIPMTDDVEADLRGEVPPQSAGEAAAGVLGAEGQVPTDDAVVPAPAEGEGVVPGAEGEVAAPAVDATTAAANLGVGLPPALITYLDENGLASWVASLKPGTSAAEIIEMLKQQGHELPTE